MDKKVVYTGNGILFGINFTTWMDFKNILNERNQPQRSMYYMASFT